MRIDGTCQRRRGLLIGLPLLALSGCNSLFVPSSVTLSAQDMQTWLQRHFPLDRRLLEVFDVTVATPQLRLLPERNRIGTAFEVLVRERLFRRSWRGQLSLDAGLRWDPADQSLRLQQVRVDEFTVDGLRGAAPGEPAERIGALVAERMLEDLVVYRLSAERLARLQRVGVVPGTITVVRDGVEITLVSASR